MQTYTDQLLLSRDIGITRELSLFYCCYSSISICVDNTYSDIPFKDKPLYAISIIDYKYKCCNVDLPFKDAIKILLGDEPSCENNSHLILSNKICEIKIMQQKYTRRYIYILKGICYDEQFPIRWALFPYSKKIETEISINTKIYGPGLTTSHCKKCNIDGSYKGVFVGYCSDCAIQYNMQRKHGYRSASEEFVERNTIDQTRLAYLSLIEGCSREPGHISRFIFDEIIMREICAFSWDVIDNPKDVGYGEAVTSCLSSGALLTGPDVFSPDNPENPVFENPYDPCNIDVIDDHLPLNMENKIIRSKRFPRRAYGVSNVFLAHNIVICKQDSEIAEFDMCKKIEYFLKENENIVEVLNNNYSFPLPVRPEWDYYRKCFRPFYWRAWSICVFNNAFPNESVKINIFMNITNIYDPDISSDIIIEFRQLSGCRMLFYDVFNAFKNWVVDNRNNPIIKNSPMVLPVPHDILLDDDTIIG